MSPAESSEQADLLRRLDAVERTREAVLERVGALSEEARTARSGEAWSVLEIVEHLVLAERSVLKGLFDPAKLKQSPPGLGTRLRRWLVMAILRSPIRVSTPSRSMDPKGEATLDELAALWRENHLRMRAFLEAADEERLRTPAFRHPISGPLTPGEAMRMMTVHLDRHVGQIEDRAPRS